jgi:hypothetical protein
MEKLFLLLVLVGLGFGAWKLFAPKKKTPAKKSTSGGSWGGNTGSESTSSETQNQI